MYFKRIEMHGFKSFAEPVTIEFDKGITCVVGPNGSGKSNISDAIRWVLGEQSPKMLRGGKMEDVIFAGTASRKSRGMAEVTLVIDNSTGILPIEYSEVAITRRMFRSGESEYEINNSQCRMRDIRELLMDTGIGVDGYSLIGQGKISDIISNKTDTIREIFEETAGIVSYRSKKAETERKLKGTVSNMERVTDIVNEIEDRIGDLKEDSEKAQEYIKLRERHKELEINITLRSIEDIDKKNEEVITDIKELDLQIKNNKDEKEKLDSLETASKEKLASLDRELEEANSLLISQIEEINTISNQKEINKERLNSIEANIERLHREKKELEEKIGREEDSQGALLARKDDIDKKHMDLLEELGKCSEKFEKITSEIAQRNQRVDDAKNHIFQYSNKISSKEAEAKSYQNLQDTLDKRKEQILGEKESGGDAFADSKAQLETAKEEYREIEEEMSKVSKETLDIKDSYQKARNDAATCFRELEQVKIDLSKVLSRKRTMEELESNYDGYNFGVKFVMRQNLNGIEGVASDLIKVPEGFEMAIETALGGTMQNIVCDNESVAKKAINLLKDNKAGRVTFLPVNSIKARPVKRHNDIGSTKGFEGYGVDIVKYDKKYEKVVEYLLGNVLVVDNMDSAIALSKKIIGGQKIVTLDGEIINPSGAVTGGKYKNKSANIFERKSEITSLETEVSSLENRERQLEESKVKLKGLEEEYLAKGSSLDQQFREFQIQLLGKKNQVNMIEKLLNDHAASEEKWEIALSNIEKEKINTETSIRETNEEISRLRNLIDQFSAQAEEAEAKSVNHKAEVEGINEEITQARIAVNACEGEKNNVDDLVKRITETVEGLKSDLLNKKNETIGLLAEKDQLIDFKNDGEEDVKEMELAKLRLEEKISQLNEEKLEENRNSIKVTTDRDFIGNAITNLQNQKYQLDIKQAKMDTQLENLKGKLWEEFEISYLQAFDFRNEEIAISTAIKENREIKGRIRELGEVNVGAIKEYEKVSERYEFLCEQKDDIEKSVNELNLIIEDIDKIIRTRFKESFDEIVTHFEEIFINFFGGGSAKITLDNEENPLDAVIEINAQPPGKQLKNINLLSGGEKTMTAIALMFAVLKTKPTPCCILDEVEAALDDHNIHVFANYLRNFDDIQFTLITHQKTTMEHADVMYGVTMPERGISKVFSLKLGDTLPT
ncbi:MAG: chromosome segregation protein SMC [Anaerovoracaceae bacterium]